MTNLDPPTSDPKHPVVVEKSSDSVTVHMSRVATYLGILSLLVGAMVTAAGFVFASAQLVSKLDDLGKRVGELTSRLDKQESADLEFWKDKWPVVESVIKQVHGDAARVDRIEDRLHQNEINVSAIKADVDGIKDRVRRVEGK